MLFNAADGEAGLEKAVAELCDAAAKAVREGAPILILSDRGVDQDKAPIPSLLATAAVHHHLIRQGTRTQCGLVIETGEAREVHHFCLLIGYGAGAVNPYLAFETLADMHRQGSPARPTSPSTQAKKNYIKAANKGIIKVASKMGISTVQSYRGAQIFEAVGLSKDAGREVLHRHRQPARRHPAGGHRARRAWPATATPSRPSRSTREAKVLDNGGQYQWRRDGEYHMWNPDTVAKLQQAVRITGYPTFKEYSKLVNDESRHRCTIRGLLNFKKVADARPARRGRAGQGDRQAVRHRRDELRVDLARRRTRTSRSR